MDAALVFDKGGRQTLFAQCDEHATEWQIAKSVHVIARDPGFESHFLLKKFETEFPLREKERRVHYILDLATWQFFLDDGSRKIAGTARISKNPQNTWLCPDLELLANKECGFSLREEVEAVDVLWNGLDKP